MSGNLYHGSPLEKFQIFQFCKLSKFVKSAKLDFENAKKNGIFRGPVQNCCCCKDQIGKMQLSTILFSENRPGGRQTLGLF